ncbi:MAG: type II toxin-antitoxin system PemK/MazF family toxin [Pseudomonadota bacterium]
MAADFPSAGQVFDYHYLWKWQADRGETEGRKKRPSCVVIVVANAKGQHVLFIAPITSKAPKADRTSVQIPETEARRAKLDTDVPLWIVVDELNADVLEQSFTLEERSPRGSFSPAFTDAILRKVQSLREASKLRVSSRS